MTKTLTILAAILTCGVAAAQRPTVDATDDRWDRAAEAYLGCVEQLADPNLAGRLVGSAGTRRAGDWIAGRFDRLGLTPAGDKGYFQRFGVDRLRRPGAGTALAVAGAEPLSLGRDFSPVAAGARGRFAGPLAFAGYGVSTDTHDDYADVDLAGAVVLAFRYEPHDRGRSLLTGSGAWSGAATYHAKARAAAEAGAAALLIVSPPSLAQSPDVLAATLGAGDAPLPIMRVSINAAERLLAAAGESSTLAELESAVADGAGRAFVTDLRIEGRCEFAAARG